MFFQGAFSRFFYNQNSRCALSFHSNDSKWRTSWEGKRDEGVERELETTANNGSVIREWTYWVGMRMLVKFPLGWMIDAVLMWSVLERRENGMSGRMGDETFLFSKAIKSTTGRERQWLLVKTKQGKSVSLFSPLFSILIFSLSFFCVRPNFKARGSSVFPCQGEIKVRKSLFSLI